MIGGGLRLTGQNPVSIPASASLEWKAGGTITWSAWIKPTALAPNAVIFSRRENANAFLIGVDNGVPYAEVADANGTHRSPAGAPLEANGWHHLAVVAAGSQIAMYLDGETYAKFDSPLPALNSVALVGGDATEAAASPDAAAGPAGFTGELDELEISKVARTPGFIKLAALSQGGDKAAKLLTMGNDEASAHGSEGELAKHLSLISDISKSLTFDGWAVIFLCTLLAIVGWVVTAMKFVYLNKIKKATDAFLKEWEHLAVDFSVLDHGDEQSIKSMGGKASMKTQKLMRQSPLYHIFQIGSSEIQHRLVNAREGFRGLSERSMHAIRATLDGGLVREVQRLNSNLVFLTIGIAGGPYLGLLGTVIGVMITFAVIAKSGAVEVNSIAPGIAGALLATVAGLAVAIPALFAYSYISSRIKDAVSEMQIFIDEFVAKIAESFPSSND
jgi:biopolymer transport protein ExbB